MILSDGWYVVLNDHGATLYTEGSDQIDVTFHTLDKSEGWTKDNLAKSKTAD